MRRQHVLYAGHEPGPEVGDVARRGRVNVVSRAAYETGSRPDREKKLGTRRIERDDARGGACDRYAVAKVVSDGGVARWFAAAGDDDQRNQGRANSESAAMRAGPEMHDGHSPEWEDARESSDAWRQSAHQLSPEG